MRRRFLLSVTLALFAGSPAFAQKAPSDLQPLPEVPPPPPMVDNVPEPEVTIIKRGEDTVEEYRINGQLYMMKVTPPHGKPYYLVNNKGDGKWLRQDDLSGKVSVPMWVIMSF
ncbi:MAG: DUF2782 domain-containing protein [Zoogloeaceae bacterium]|jgi:hypothetical protein|nr:DUF2782 domain-containing protein [Zoogloeaceae bacterium]